MLGVHPITVARWETGERAPDIYTLKRLAAALNTTVGALLDEPSPAEGAV
jgi:transcriptional regulator with XRE-family HTH domain